MLLSSLNYPRRQLTQKNSCDLILSHCMHSDQFNFFLRQKPPEWHSIHFFHTEQVWNNIGFTRNKKDLVLVYQKVDYATTCYFV